ncbi:hypothetical protein KKA87_07255 [bacterium]|nr:hypothetical protein [bacterium]MBU1872420.1 hypothetical protein [bacterium]
MIRNNLLLFIFVFSTLSLSQDLEDIGAGVIDFLLKNPKTANKMSGTESVALDIIGDLLKTESERKHQLEYASAGRNQVTINSNDGRQAQFVKNESGKVYLLVDGVIYPIATELVNQAKGIDINVKSHNNDDFDLNKLKSDYNGNKTYNFNIKAAFPFKWCDDLDEDGFIGFHELKQIKKQYYDNENFQILVNLETKDNCNEDLILTIIDDYTGNHVFYSKYEIPWKEYKNMLHYFKISSGILPIGKYIYKVKLVDRETSKVHNVFFDTFEIIIGNLETKEISFNETLYRQNNIHYSTPKGIFFSGNWIDKNKNNLKEFDEFLHFNEESYSLTKDTLRISINFPEKSGGIIIQSLTKEGQILGTTTKSYQILMTNWIFPGSNPYDSMDFIDMVKINGPGEYKIRVSFVEGGTFEKELSIVE